MGRTANHAMVSGEYEHIHSKKYDHVEPIGSFWAHRSNGVPVVPAIKRVLTLLSRWYTWYKSVAGPVCPTSCTTTRCAGLLKIAAR